MKQNVYVVQICSPFEQLEAEQRTVHLADDNGIDYRSHPDYQKVGEMYGFPVFQFRPIKTEKGINA